MMNYKREIFRAVIFVQVFFLWHHGVAPSSHTPYTFSDLLVYVAKSGQSLHYNDMQVILKKLHFENCSRTDQKQECHRCLTTTDLGLDSFSVLNSTEFAVKSLAIVYSLLPEGPSGQENATCKGIPSLPSKQFETLVSNFTHDQSSHTITTHALEHILDKVNTTLGPHLTKKKCFSAESIIEEVHKGESGHEHEHSSNETGLDEEDFQKACAIIVYRLIQGYCIEEHEKHSNLPSASFFIEDLFKNKKFLTEEDLKAITTKLNIAKDTQTNSGSDHDGHNHDGHNHKRRRRAAVEATSTPTSSTPHNMTCFSLDSLMNIFGIEHSVGASKSDFKELCPAFLQQVQSGSCTKAKKKTTASHSHSAEVWGYGFLSVTIISLVSLLGVATIPFVGKAMYKKVLALLVALAVGSLAGDGTLHLIPHAFGLHEHQEDGDHSKHEDKSKSFVWKATVVLASIYVFYLFEVLMHFCLKRKHNHIHVDSELPGPTSRHMSFKKRKSCSDFEHHEGMPQKLGNSEDKVPEENGDIILTNVPQGPRCHSPQFHNCVQVFENDTGTNSESDVEDMHFTEHAKTEDGLDQAASIKPPLSKKISSLKQSLSRRSVFSDEKHEKDNPKGISAVAWMIIIGDTIHNISDGLAIGAAFSEGGSSGISGGISTSIAVFCHELPHELGDFAVLLTAGMSVKKALLANFLSACSCYIGLVIGIFIGQQVEVRLWIFAIAGGMFLYVALVDMLPDLMHSESLQTDTLITFLLQNIGLLLGIAIMLIIAVYEEDLMAAVKLG